MKLFHVLFFVLILQNGMFFCSDLPEASISSGALRLQETEQDASIRVQKAWACLVEAADNFDISENELKNDIEECKEALLCYQKVQGIPASQQLPKICDKTREIFRLLESKKH